MFKRNFYLIDYENVNRNGLYGLEKLSSNDEIYIFTSQQHRLDDYDYLNISNYTIFEVPPGSQSVDKNLIFYLGYLIGKFGSNTLNYIIISNDKGYDKIINFWKKEIYDINIKRFPSISAERDTSIIYYSLGFASSFSTTLSDEKVLCDDIRRELSNNYYDIYTSNDVVSIVSKYFKSKHILSLVHNNLQMKYSYPSNWNIYIIIKPILKRYQLNLLNNSSQNSNNTKKINNIIQRILSNEGFFSNVVNHTASIVSNNYSKKNGKQIIYQSLISEYGFEEGLNIYNYIRKYI